MNDKVKAALISLFWLTLLVGMFVGLAIMAIEYSLPKMGY